MSAEDLKRLADAVCPCGLGPDVCKYKQRGREAMLAAVRECERIADHDGTITTIEKIRALAAELEATAPNPHPDPDYSGPHSLREDGALEDEIKRRQPYTQPEPLSEAIEEMIRSLLGICPGGMGCPDESCIVHSAVAIARAQREEDRAPLLAEVERLREVVEVARDAIGYEPDGSAAFQPTKYAQYLADALAKLEEK